MEKQLSLDSTDPVLIPQYKQNDHTTTEIFLDKKPRSLSTLSR